MTDPHTAPRMPAGEREYRKTATIRASQWWKMGDHSAVVLKSAPGRYADDGVPWVETLEGGHVVTPGDWIATGVKGEHWPIKPDVFAASYESVDMPASVDARVEVTQDDREAAALYAEKVECQPASIVAMVRSGHPVDYALSIHMARHRLASQARAADDGREVVRLRDACKPWEFHAGPPPEYDSPLSAVYDAGIGYAYERLAELLGVTDYQGGDGSEDYATDVMNTGRNILVAAGYANDDGDLLAADELRSTPPAPSEPTRASAGEVERDQGCRMPPEGWWCSRARGHEGPCAARRTDKPIGAGWSPPPTADAKHDERLTAEELAALGAGVSEWAYEHLARGYGVTLTVREVKRLIAALRPQEAPADMTRAGEATRLIAWCQGRADTLRAHAEASFYPEATKEYRAKECAYREVAAHVAALTPPALPMREEIAKTVDSAAYRLYGTDAVGARESAAYLEGRQDAMRAILALLSRGTKGEG